MGENYTVDTPHGEILITKAAMSSIVKDAVEAQEGKAFLTNSKGKLISGSSLFNYNNEYAAMDIDCIGSYPDVTVYIAVRFGASIAAVTGHMIEAIHDGFQESLGFHPESVSVIVTGTVSKNIAKRNIEIVKKYNGE